MSTLICALVNLKRVYPASRAKKNETLSETFRREKFRQESRIGLYRMHDSWQDSLQDSFFFKREMNYYVSVYNYIIILLELHRHGLRCA